MLSGAVMSTATQSSARSLLVHKRCSGITGRLVTNPNYVCRRCIDKAWPIIDRTVTEVEVDGTMLDVEATFCFLSDILCSGGGCGRAIVTRCCVACGIIRKLLPVLTARPLSFQIRGKVYDACDRSPQWNIWIKAINLQRLLRNNHAWIPGSEVSATEMNTTPRMSLEVGGEDGMDMYIVPRPV